MKVASTVLQKTNFENLFQVAVGSFKQCYAVKNCMHPSTMHFFLMNN